MSVKIPLHHVNPTEPNAFLPEKNAVYFSFILDFSTARVLVKSPERC